MGFLDLARQRHSVRAYTPEAIEEEKIEAIIEAGRVAPTAANLQPVRIIVLNSQEKLAKASKASNLHEAPLAFLICVDHSQVWRRPYDGQTTAHIDAAIVTDHMMMEATDLGLGSVWICYFDPEVISAEFELSKNIEPVNILAVGYSSQPPASLDRHNTERISSDDLVIG